MMMAPIMRVLSPQLVVQAYSISLFWSRNLMSNAFAKFWPRKWLVPDCSAQPFPIIASMVVAVDGAGELLALALACPGMTGMAASLMAKSV
jgi:hypothetical protein